MLIFCLLLFQFPKIKIKTSLPITVHGPPPLTNTDATTSLQRPSINASLFSKPWLGASIEKLHCPFIKLASIHRIHQPMVYFGRLIKYIRKQKINIKWLYVCDFLLVFNIYCLGYILWYYCLWNLGSCICFWSRRGLFHDMRVCTGPFGLILRGIS